MLEPAIELRTPMRAWVVVFAGMCINLCLGILYAWSIWKANLIANAQHAAGTAMSGLNEGWIYLTDAQATWAYAICGITFAIFMIPGGLLQDRLGPRLGAALFFPPAPPGPPFRAAGPGPRGGGPGHPNGEGR